MHSGYFHSKLPGVVSSLLRRSKSYGPTAVLLRSEKKSKAFLVTAAASSAAACGLFWASIADDNKHASCESAPHHYCSNSTDYDAHCHCRATWDENWDHRHTYRPQSENSVTRTIILIRHGQYVESKKPEERVLTELGRQQAKLTAERLEKAGFRFSNIYISSMPRAFETGQIIASRFKDVQVKVDDNLQEGIPAIPVPAMESYHPKAYKVFRDSARIEAAFRTYFHRDHQIVKASKEAPAASPSSSVATGAVATDGQRDVATQGEQTDTGAGQPPPADAGLDTPTETVDLIVAHGNVIRYFLCRVLQLPPQAWLRFAIYNCGVSVVKIRPNGKVSITSIGDIGHLPPDMVTYS